MLKISDFIDLSYLIGFIPYGTKPEYVLINPFGLSLLFDCFLGTNKNICFNKKIRG